MGGSARSAFLLWGIAIGIGCLLALVGSAQEYSLEELEAVTLYRMPAFVKWPAENLAATDESFTLCLLGGGRLLEELSFYEGRPAKQRSLRVVRVGDPARVSGCQLLFVPREREIDLVRLGRSAARSGCLTVGDAPAFARSGGMIGLVLRDRHLHLEVNLRAAGEAGLELSSDLLALATIFERPRADLETSAPGLR